VSANKPNISQIRKYLNGELDARAMYELERQAQDDPFLMDVIKGMEDGENHQHSLDTIERLIDQRVQQDKTRVIPIYRYWPAAACLLIALGIGSWWLTRNTTPKSLVAVNISQAKQADTIKMKQAPAVAQTNSKQLEIPADTELPLTRATKKQPPADVEILSPSPVLTEEMARRDTATNKIAEAKDRAIAIEPGPAALNKAPDNQVTGKVVDDKGQPLPGVVVKVKDQPTIAATTDAHGNYKIITPHDSTELTYNFVGFDTKELLAVNKKAVNVTMESKNTGLDEVVVVAYGSQKRTSVTGAVGKVSPKMLKQVAVTDTSSNKEAHPAIGWQNYQNYINQQAVMTDGIMGDVSVAVNVAVDGNLSRIRIISSTDKALNDKAIDIIKNGPKWIGGPKSKKISLRISFHK
jgi:hypothetical protein